MYDLVTIGHAARDEFAGDPEWRIGGTAVYAAAAAARFGARAALVTRVGPHERERLVGRCARLGITLHALQSEVTTTFAFRYVDGKRQLRLKARAKGIAAEALPADVRETRSVVFASIAHELDRSLFGVFAGVPRVLVAQGYLRTWDADGTVRRRDWDEASEVLPQVSVAVLSEEDLGGDVDAARRWSAVAPVIVTIAERGALILRDGRDVVVPGFAADAVVDPTGAGDAFAAGLGLALADGRDLVEAARFANAVASFAVEAVGIDGLADRARVEQRINAQSPD